MIKNIIVMHIAGTCGDLISIPWINTNLFYSAIQSHNLTNSGRMMPVWNNEFLTRFPRQPNKHHYMRDWSDDLDMLANINKPFFINTASIEQVNLFKNYFKDDIHTIAVNYNKAQWPIVVKNFCTKVLDGENYLTRDDIGENFLNVVAKTPKDRDYFLDLEKRKELGYWYAKNLIAGHIHFPPYSFTCHADTIINLDEIHKEKKLCEILDRASQQIGVKLDLLEFLPLYRNWLANQNLPSKIDNLLS